MFIGVIALSITVILIIVLIKFKVRLGIVMLCGAIIMSLFARLPVAIIFDSFTLSVTDPETVKLMLMVAGLTAVGYLMKFTGNLDEIIDNLRIVISDVRVLISLIPALIGLLAVTGGAVMSAPLIKRLGDEGGLDKNEIATANIVFRHINAFITPMSTGLILMSSVSDIGIMKFIKFNIPIMIIVVPLMFLYIFRNVKPAKIKRGKITVKMFIRLFVSLLPFIIIITLGIGFHVYFPLAFLIGILHVIFSTKTNSDYLNMVKGRASAAFKGIKWDMVFSAAAVMIFKDIVTVTGFLNEISIFLTEMGVPLAVLAVLFPLIAGLVIGNSNAAIGLSIPLFLTIIPAGINVVPYYNLIFIAAAIGYISSPLHLCTLLTVEYYNASLHSVLKQVALFGLGVLAVALLRFAILV